MKKAIWIVFLLTSLIIPLIPVSAQPATGLTFVGIYGIVNSWGGQPSYGKIGAFAEVPDKWAEAGLFWTPGIVTILSLPANYTFYVARLNVTDKARLEYLGYSFYVSGWWNAYKITIEYDRNGIIIRKTIEPIAEKGFGELKVVGWKDFTVKIQSIELITGIVRCYRIWLPPPYEIVRGDLNLDGKIDIFDLVHVARRHRTSPGRGIGLDSYEYDFNSDFNLDDKIDLDDLIVVAKDFGKTYGTL